jgi:dipeptidyl aminopeptidase/acylaminoacyl peptidase
MQLIHRLVTADMQFDLEVYPGNSHAIAAARAHLYRRLLAHFERWLAED